MKWIMMLVFLVSCSIFNKSDYHSDELVELTNDVLKKNQGIEIEVKPIPKDEKK